MNVSTAVRIHFVRVD